MVSGQLSEVAISPLSSCSYGIQLEDPYTQLHHLEPPVFRGHEQWLSYVQLHQEDPTAPGETVVPEVPSGINSTQPLPHFCLSCSSSSLFLPSLDPCSRRAVWAPSTQIAD